MFVRKVIFVLTLSLLSPFVWAASHGSPVPPCLTLAHYQSAVPSEQQKMLFSAREFCATYSSVVCGGEESDGYKVLHSKEFESSRQRAVEALVSVEKFISPEDRVDASFMLTAEDAPEEEWLPQLYGLAKVVLTEIDETQMKDPLIVSLIRDISINEMRLGTSGISGEEISLAYHNIAGSTMGVLFRLVYLKEQGNEVAGTLLAQFSSGLLPEIQSRLSTI